MGDQAGSQEGQSSSPMIQKMTGASAEHGASTPLPTGSKIEDPSMAEVTPAPGTSAASQGQKIQDGKVFVGGLSWETTDARLRQYFENYGAVQEAYVSYDRHTGRPRGFGFVVFSDPQVVDKVVVQQHTIDRREVEAKKALPKEESPVSKDMQAAASGQRTKKIFVGGLAGTVDEEVFTEYFGRFGKVKDAVVMYDQQNRRPRGFGFITFAEEEAVDAVFAKGTIHILHEKQIEIKRAIPRDAGPIPSPKALYRSPHERHYGFRSPGAAGTPGHIRHDFAMGAPMMNVHPMKGMEGPHSPLPEHMGVVTGIPASVMSPGDPSGYMHDPHAASMAAHGIPHSPMMSHGLPHTATPQGMGRDPYSTLATQSHMAGASEPTPSFPVADGQQLNVPSMPEVQQTISLASVSEALEQLSQTPGQPRSQTQQQGPSQTSPTGQKTQGTLWN